jgi:hypothetical protein
MAVGDNFSELFWKYAYGYSDWVYQKCGAEIILHKLKPWGYRIADTKQRGIHGCVINLASCPQQHDN